MNERQLKTVFLSKSSGRSREGPDDSQQFDASHCIKLAVDKSSRRTADAIINAFVIVLQNLWRVRAGGHLTVKLFKVESNLSGMAAEVSIAKSVWTEVKKPVHLPELSLRGGSLSGFGRS